MLSLSLYSCLMNICPPLLLLSQVWNVRSAHQLCPTPTWTGGGLVQHWEVRWTWSLAVKPRTRVQYRTSTHQGAPCLLHSADPKGRGSSAATRCVRSATSSSTQPHRPKFTTMANPTRSDSSRSAMARCQAPQVGPECCLTGRPFVCSLFSKLDIYPEHWIKCSAAGLVTLCSTIGPCRLTESHTLFTAHCHQPPCANSPRLVFNRS